jgi:hypothetical protein
MITPALCGVPQFVKAQCVSDAKPYGQMTRRSPTCVGLTFST